jgi:outer membrane protein OmpA-like peptidoglycan-associated protein
LASANGGPQSATTPEPDANADDSAAAIHSVSPLPPSPGIPLVRGLTLVSALRAPEGDRENTVQVTSVAPEGATYTWHFIQHNPDGSHAEHKFGRFVNATDLASAPRINIAYGEDEPHETPGYTAMSISRSAFNLVRADGHMRYTLATLIQEPAATGIGGPEWNRVPFRGTLSLASATDDSLPILLNGHRITVPATRFKGRFAYQERKLEPDFWILADSVHPLLLKAVMGTAVFQMVRIDLPADSAQRAASIENDLDRGCRAELPGIYFAFASAELEPGSDPAISGVATLLARHPAWSFAIEGHTDSIGDPASNQKLSVDRAQAVRSALVQRHGIASARLSFAGFGSTRPRESNTTLEGRARNRRVELARDCSADMR